jgi:hypothetical protein
MTEPMRENDIEFGVVEMNTDGIYLLDESHHNHSLLYERSTQTRKTFMSYSSISPIYLATLLCSLCSLQTPSYLRIKCVIKNN